MNNYIEQTRQAYPFFAVHANEGILRSISKYIKKGLKPAPMWYSKEMGYAYYAEDELLETGNILIEKLSEDRAFIDKIIANWNRIQEEIKHFIGKVKGIDKLKANELLMLIKEFDKLYSDFWKESGLVEPMDIAIMHNIRDEIEERTKDKKEQNEILQILTTPIGMTYNLEKDKRIYEIIKKKGQDADAEIGKLYDDFFWIECNYGNQEAVSIDYFYDLLKKYAEEKFVFKYDKAGLKKERDETIKMYSISEKGRFVINLIDKFNKLHDDRKKYQTILFYYVNLVLNEISKKIGIDTKFLKYALPREIDSVIEGSITKDMLKERRNLVLFDVSGNGTEIYVGEKANQQKERLTSNVDQNLSDFDGLTACPGNAVGRVQIIHTLKEIKNFEEGNILVTGMTTPEYVPAMKRAVAIVTDEGGVTCHAAIISRELKIPCIVGTKIATKVLSDGNLVEVKANHGIIKILEK